MSGDLDNAEKSLLKEIAARREGTEVCFYEPARLLSKETLAIIERGAESVKTHVAKTGYCRLLAADLLPQDVRRALYLDGDIVCTGSLEPLFAIDLKGCPAAMCPDPPQHSQMSTYNRLGYPPAEGYCNSGVILLDLCLWREENLSKPMIGWLAANAQKRICHDQDVINACLHGRVAHPDYSCNVMTTCFNVFHWIKEEGNGYLARQTQYLPKSERPALRAAVEKPRLVHFYGALKPWRRDCAHPFAPVWRCFCALPLSLAAIASSALRYLQNIPVYAEYYPVFFIDAHAPATRKISLYEG